MTDWKGVETGSGSVSDEGAKKKKASHRAKLSKESKALLRELRRHNVAVENELELLNETLRLSLKLEAWAPMEKWAPAGPRENEDAPGGQG